MVPEYEISCRRWEERTARLQDKREEIPLITCSCTCNTHMIWHRINKLVIISSVVEKYFHSNNYVRWITEIPFKNYKTSENEKFFSITSLVHGPFTNSGLTTFCQRCWHWISDRSGKCLAMISNRSLYSSTNCFNLISWKMKSKRLYEYSQN